MDAILQLFINRDQQMCDAYLQVNEKKPGYVQRSETLYIKSSFSTKLMRDESAEAMLEDPSIVLCIEKHYLLKPYRCSISLLWNIKNEWVLIIIDPAAHSVEIIYPQYSVDVLQASSGDERVANSIWNHNIARIMYLRSGWSIVASLEGVCLLVAQNTMGGVQFCIPDACVQCRRVSRWVLACIWDHNIA